jgi:hypothetical protein
MKTFLREFLKFIIGQVLVGLILTGTILWLQMRYGIVPKLAREANIWAVAYPYIWLLTLLIAWNFVRTAYVLYREDEAEIKRLGGELELCQALAKSVLTLPQLEILQLTREFRVFLADLGPSPTLPDNAPPDEWEVAEKRRREWARKLIFTYREQFSARVQRVVNSLGSAGMDVFRLGSFVDASIQSEYACQEILRMLLWFVLELESRAEDGRIAIDLTSIERGHTEAEG